MLGADEAHPSLTASLDAPRPAPRFAPLPTPLLQGPRRYPADTPLGSLALGLSPALRLALAHRNVSYVGDLDGLTVADVEGFGVLPAALARLRGALCGPAASARASDGDAGSPERAPLLDREYPDWFLGMPIAVLRLTPRLAHALAGAALIGDLRGMGEEAVLGVAGLNAGALARLRDRVRLAYLDACAARERARQA